MEGFAQRNRAKSANEKSFSYRVYKIILVFVMVYLFYFIITLHATSFFLPLTEKIPSYFYILNILQYKY